jgi:hypothetical protein
MTIENEEGGQTIDLSGAAIEDVDCRVKKFNPFGWFIIMRAESSKYGLDETNVSFCHTVTLWVICRGSQFLDLEAIA